MKKILILNKCQFGYHTDSWKYCEYLKNDYEITYCCFDNGHPKIEIDKIETIYISSVGNYLSRAIRFYKSIFLILLKHKFSIVFIVNFDFCFIIQLFSTTPKYILDIRTGSVSNITRTRKFQNLKIKLNTLFFKNITIVSEGLGNMLGIKKFIVLHLGSDYKVTHPKSYQHLKLLYIGTLDFRDIHQTIEGLKLFINDNRINHNEILYDIIGFGSKSVEQEIKQKISDLDLEKIVKFHGRKNPNQLVDYLSTSNIGISYIPTTKYYDFQPPTKTFEYIHSGMVCIATRTSENCKLINSKNGVLCESNAISFAYAIKEVYNNRSSYNSNVINETLINHTWSNIINNILKPYLLRVING